MHKKYGMANGACRAIIRVPDEYPTYVFFSTLRLGARLRFSFQA